MTSNFRWLTLLFAMLILFTAGFALGFVVNDAVRAAAFPTEGSSTESAPDFDLMGEAWEVIQRNYVDRSALDPRDLTYGAISGMVMALGDTGHTTFLSPEMVVEQRNLTQGEFEGIGAYLEVKDGQPTVVAPIDGSPAKEAGVLPGDIIVSVDGEDVLGLAIHEVVERVTGPAGTEVTITFMNPESGELRTLTITRARIEIENVTWQMLPETEIAQVRITAFSEGVSEDLDRALDAVQEAGAESIILDLRSNPGGLLSEAIGVASRFLAEGNVMLMRDAEGETISLEVERGKATAPDIPMVVLINGGSASAAEIVSGALKDAGRAVLVGETTFGTGTVLNQFPLSDGSALLLATQEWLTPAGETFWHVGIDPNVEVALPDGAIPLIPAAGESLTAGELQETEDAQLLKAIELLQGN